MSKNFLYSFAKVLCPLIFSILTPIEFIGKIPSLKGRAIICSNHLSAQDPVYIGIFHERQIYFIAKAELFKNKLSEMFLKKLGAFPVVRGVGDTQALNRAQELLQNDEIVGIFIEGTRSKTGELMRPKNGAAMLAYENDAAVLPMCITGASGGKVKLFQKVYVSCGEPITPKELGIIKGTGTEIRHASRKIMDKIAQMRNIHLEKIDSSKKICVGDSK